MKSLFTLSLLAAYAFLIGCSGPSYKQFNYEYMSPAEYKGISSDHKFFAAQVSGEDLNRPLTEFTHDIAGLTWTDNYNDANILVSVKIEKTKVYKDVVTETTEELINNNGKKETIRTYTYPGFIHTPYSILITDQKNNLEIINHKETYETKVTGSPQKSRKSAESSLALTARVKKSDSRKDALSHIHKQTKRLLDIQLTDHTKEMVFEVPEKDDKEPRIAEAYQLLTSNPNLSNAKSALAIYEAIGTANQTAKGEKNEKLNKAVHAGMAACHYILGDLKAYEENKKLAKRTFSFSSNVSTNSAF